MPHGESRSAKSRWPSHERQNPDRYEFVSGLDARAWVSRLAGYSLVYGGRSPRKDRTIMDWCVANGYIVFTHDLDFGTMLALTHAAGPSVLQVRAIDVLPDHLEGVVIGALKQHEADLASGRWSSWTRAKVGSVFCQFKGR